MDKELIFLVEESPDGCFTAKALEHAIFTQAETYEELKEAAKEAVKCHFEDDEMPRIIRLHLVKDEVIAV